MSSKLIAIDLDGTTLNNQSRLSNRTIVTLQKLQHAGHHVVIATGRPYRISKDIYQELGLKSPMVNFNGALCHQPFQANWKEYFHKTLEVDLVLELLERREEFGIDWISVEGKEDIYSSYENIPANFFFPEDTRAKLITSTSVIQEEPTAMNLFMEREKQETIQNLLLQEYGSNRISVRSWGGDMPCLEIVSAGIQKALGVEIVARSYGVSQKDILAFGDEDNDIEMIDYAGHGVVMKNGIEPLKKIADDITAFTNDEDGLAIYLEDYFQLS